MIWGLSTTNFTTLHILISLAGIGTGLFVLWGLLRNRWLAGWNAVFLVTTLLTSITGFGFPFEHLLPAHKVGILSLVLLAVALVALNEFHLARGWRRTYVITAMASLYLNIFVLIVQLFQKVPALHGLAPTQKEPPFAIVQLLVLAVFAWFTVQAARRYRGEAAAAV